MWRICGLDLMGMKWDGRVMVGGRRRSISISMDGRYELWIIKAAAKQS